MGPLTYTILPNEDTATLKTAFKQVRKAAEEHGNGFAKFTEIMCDYDSISEKLTKKPLGMITNTDVEDALSTLASVLSRMSTVHENLTQ